MKKATSKRLTRKQRAELKSLAALPDSAIDTSDAPELLDWSGAKRGLFYRPVKQHVSLRVDADILARLRGCGKGYQTRINTLLRQAVDNLVPSAIRIRMTEIGVWPRRGVRHER